MLMLNPEASMDVTGQPRYAWLDKHRPLRAHHDLASFPCFIVAGLELRRVMSVFLVEVFRDVTRVARTTNPELPTALSYKAQSCLFRLLSLY